MDDISWMHEIDATEELVEDELDHLLGEELLWIDQPFECILHIFHAKIDLIEGKLVVDTHDIIQSDNIAMLEEFYIIFYFT